jgi:hypothetical protein
MIFFYMKSPNEYNWLNSYISWDNLWIDDSLNWDNIFDVLVLDGILLFATVSSSFSNTHFFIDQQTKFSLLDFLNIAEHSYLSSSKEFSINFFLDQASYFHTVFPLVKFLFSTDYQDFLITLTYHSPELITTLIDFIKLHWFNNSFSAQPSALFDLFSDNLNLTLFEFIEYFILILFYTWVTVMFITFFRILNWKLSLESYSVRFIYYFFSFSRDVRLQYESVILIVFYFFLHFSFMVASFDDDQEETIEWIHALSFYIFLGIFIYMVYKYSIHYFSFLQASESKGKFFRILIQFAQDMVNTFALFLRFIVLMIRLNMYDFLDDVLDSYYIFLCDFDDDEYFTETFFFVFGLLFFDTDNHDDRSLFFEDELDFSLDLFSLYFVNWSKFTFFFFFCGRRGGQSVFSILLSLLNDFWNTSCK